MTERMSGVPRELPRSQGSGEARADAPDPANGRRNGGRFARIGARRPDTRPGATETAPGEAPAWRRHAFAYVLVAPLALVMLVVIAYPLFNTVQLSLTDAAIIGGPAKFVGLDNYGDVLKDGAFWSAVRRSAIWLVGNMVMQTLLAFGAALLLNRNGWVARRARVWLMFPWVIPSVAVAIIWQWMLNSNYGVVSHVLEVANVISSPLNVFGQESSSLFALILVNAWHWFPLSAVIVLGALQTIPEELYEAATVDGAGAWRTFWQITFPLLGRVLFALGLVGTLWSFNIMDTIYLITRGGPADASTTTPVFIYNEAFKSFHAADAAAASVVSIVLLGIFAALYLRFARPKEI
jgi:multiple sugar transport system permease protein